MDVPSRPCLINNTHCTPKTNVARCDPGLPALEGTAAPAKAILCSLKSDKRHQCTTTKKTGAWCTDHSNAASPHTLTCVDIELEATSMASLSGYVQPAAHAIQASTLSLPNLDQHGEVAKVAFTNHEPLILNKGLRHFLAHRHAKGC